MIFVPFRKPDKAHAHGINAINYLLNHRVDLGTARVLMGNEKLTRSIINSIKNEEKLSVGCLSFEEENIDEKLKYKLMAEFEEMLLPGMQDRVNVLWVEHRDKGALELNYVIPKIDLKTGKSLNPYYFKQDKERVDLWKNLQNLKYGFSDPNDPTKKRNVEYTKEEFLKIEDYEKLDQALQSLVKIGKIQNRDQLVSFCKDHNVDVTRAGNDYLALKLPGSKKAKRFKHSIYTSRFTSLSMLKTFAKEKENEIEEYEKVDIRAEIEKKEKEVQKFIDWKRAQLQKDFNIEVEEPKIQNKTYNNNSRHSNSHKNSYSQSASYQNKLFFENYNHHATTDLLGFYVDLKNRESINIRNRRKNIDIKDVGSKITSTSRKRGIQSVQERVRLMLDMAIAKGWNIQNLNIKGDEKFKKEVKKQIEILKENNNVVDRRRTSEENARRRDKGSRFRRDEWRSGKLYKSDSFTTKRGKKRANFRNSMQQM